jgi:hypothetical protein
MCERPERRGRVPQSHAREDLAEEQHATIQPSSPLAYHAPPKTPTASPGNETQTHPHSR